MIGAKNLGNGKFSLVAANNYTEYDLYPYLLIPPNQTYNVAVSYDWSKLVYTPLNDFVNDDYTR